MSQTMKIVAAPKLRIFGKEMACYCTILGWGKLCLIFQEEHGRVSTYEVVFSTLVVFYSSL